MGANRRGNRSEKREQGMALAHAFPERMRERMAPLLDRYMAAFEFDLDHHTFEADECPTCHRTGTDEPAANPAHRTAMDLYPRIMRAIGASDDAIERLLASMNLNNALLPQAASLYHASQEITQDEADRQWLAYGRRRIKGDADFRRWAREVLFGEREVEQESSSVTERTETPRAATNGAGYGSEVSDG